MNKDGQRRTITDLLAYPHIGWAQLAEIWPELTSFDGAIREQIEIDALYAGYLDRHDADIAAYRKDEAWLCRVIWITPRLGRYRMKCG